MIAQLRPVARITCHAGATHSTAPKREPAKYEKGDPTPPAIAKSQSRCLKAAREWLITKATETHSNMIQKGANWLDGQAIANSSRPSWIQIVSSTKPSPRQTANIRKSSG